MNTPFIIIFAFLFMLFCVGLFIRWIDKNNVADMTKYAGNDWRNGLKKDDK